MSIDSIKKTFQTTEFVPDKKSKVKKALNANEDDLIEDRESDSDFDPEKQEKPVSGDKQQQWDDEENYIGSGQEDNDAHSGSDADGESSEEEHDEVYPLEE